MTDESLPRLPPAPERVQLELDLTKVEPTELILKPDWAPFPEPDLLPTSRVRRAVVASRVLLFLWSAGLVIAAFAERSRAGDLPHHPTAITVLAWTGIGVTALAAALGWRWSDRKTQNVHMLEARLPTRFWCARAWIAPFAWFALLAVTVLQLAPGELLDVRPAIAAPVFAAALWRPYALVRRIVASLIRLRFDPLIGTAYVLDLAAFGLLWWRLWTLPDVLGSSTAGSVDVLVGVTSAAAMALAANVFVWALLIGNVERAEAHRLTAVRTRHDHRQLRLRGIDPMDREVRWALLKIKAARDEERAVAAVTNAATELADEPPQVREVVAPEAAPALEPEPEPEPVVAAEPEPEPEPEPVVAEVVSEVVTDTETVESVEPAVEPVVPAGIGGAERLLDRLQDLRASTPPVEVAAEPPTADEVAPAAVARKGAGVLPRRHRFDDAPGRQGALFGDGGALADSGESLLRRLEAYGITPGPVVAEPALGSYSQFESEESHDRWVPPKLYGLEMARYVLVLAVVAVVTTSIWITYRSVSVGSSLSNGRIGLGDVNDLDLSRRSVVVTLGIATAAVPLWAGVLSRYAKRAGVPGMRPWRAFLLLAVAVACNVLAFVLDGGTRGGTSLLFLFGSLAAAMVAAETLAPVQRWFGLQTVTSLIWWIGLGVIVVTSWIGGLQQPVTETNSLEWLTFFAAFQTILAGVLAVIVTLSSSDIVDEVKLASARVESVEAPAPVGE